MKKERHRKGKDWDHAHRIVQVPNTENDNFLKSIIFQWRGVTKSMPFKTVIIPIQNPLKPWKIMHFLEMKKWKMLKIKIMHFPKIAQNYGESCIPRSGNHAEIK